DHNAGGGGGANVAGGGGGARNIVQGLFNNACRGNFPGRAGRGLTPGDDRLFFGGGGGAGHANNTTTASGGNGGGLIVLWAPYVAFGDDAVLDARGADANEVDGDGGGGGGAGGSILLLADELTGRPNIDVSGGRGADVDNPSDRCFGPGGGGGGGRLFTSTRERGRFSPFLDAGAGGNGLRLNSSECDQNEEPAGTGIPGDRRDLDLVIPFGGIEFAMDTVCGGQTVRFTDRSSGAQTVAWLIEHPTVEDITFSTDDQGLDLVLPDSVSGTYTIYQQLFRDGEGYPGDTVTITTFPSAVVTGATIEEAEEVVTVRVNDPRGFDASRYDFGDGTVIDTNVFTLRHTYTVGGDYSVAETLLNANCGDLAVATEDIIVPEFAKALIDLKDAGGCAPYELNIASRSTGTFTELRWAFPGAFPATSTSTSPTVVYADTGRYLVTLTLNDGIGPDTVASIPVTVRFTPTADFSFTVDTATVA
ncbi:MAG: PKD domain-containing protein, partial [Bacteroidota bacterium]